MDRERARHVLIPVGLVAATAILRWPRLDRPRVLVFDELFYALDATDLLRHGVEQGPVVHPPVGKWLIAGGIQVAGFDPVGWRLAALVAGCVTVLGTYFAARRLVPSEAVAAMAGAMVALDGVAFVTGRLALLDGFVAMFVALAVWAALARRWMLTALAMGLAVATKWTAAPAALVLVVAGMVAAWSTRFEGRAVLARGAAMAAIVVGVYLVAHAGWIAQAERTPEGLARCEGTTCELSLADRLDAFVDDQVRIFRFHRDLRPRNPETAPGWTWAALGGDAVLFAKPCSPPLPPAPDPFDDRACVGAEAGDRVEIRVQGNPVTWWLGLAGGVVTAVVAVRDRNGTLGVLLAAGLALWLPWLGPGREPFLFYAAPLVPVLALWGAVAVDRLRWRELGAAVAVVVALAWFVWAYPFLAGVPR